MLKKLLELNLVSSYKFIFREIYSDIFFPLWHIDGRTCVSGAGYEYHPSSKYIPNIQNCYSPRATQKTSISSQHVVNSKKDHAMTIMLEDFPGSTVSLKKE